MILPDSELYKWAWAGGLSPFDPMTINPASVDLRWSGRAKLARCSGWEDCGEQAEITLIPNRLYLLDTLEYIKIPVTYVGLLALKSSIGRAGIEHLHAGYFDPGFEGTATLEVKNLSPWPFVLKREQRIVQLAMMTMTKAPDYDYSMTGRYNRQAEPTEAR